MTGEFVDYKRYPGFWLYIELVIAAELSDNPLLSAKYTLHPHYPYDIYEVFNKALKVYEKRHQIYGK